MNKKINLIIIGVFFTHITIFSKTTRAPRIDSPELPQIAPEKNLCVEGDLTVAGNATFFSDVLFHDSVTINEHLKVLDEAQFCDDVLIEDDLIVKGSLDVEEGADIDGGLTVSSQLDVIGSASITDNVDIGCNLTVGKTAIINELKVLDEAQFCDDVLIEDDLIVKGSLDVEEGADIDGGLTVSSQLDVIGSASITDNVDIGCNLTVGKTATVSVLEVIDDAVICDDLTVKGNATILENVAIGCNLNVGKTVTASVLEVIDDAVICDDLTVKGSVSVLENVAIDCNLTVGKTATVSVLEVIDDAVICDDLTVKGNATVLDTLSTSNLEVLNDADIGCDVFVGCNLFLNDSISEDVGNIVKAETTFLHNAGGDGRNVFLGKFSGNFTLEGDKNTAVGLRTLENVESANENIALGMNAGTKLLNGNNNIYIGNIGGYPRPSALVDPAFIMNPNPWDHNNAITEEDGVIRIGTPLSVGGEILTAIEDFLNLICDLPTNITIPIEIPFLSIDFDIILPIPGLAELQGLFEDLGLCGDFFSSELMQIVGAIQPHSSAHMAGVFGVVPEITFEDILTTFASVPVNITQFGQLTAGVSSQRYKENIRSLSTEKITHIMKQLRPVIFNYKQQPEDVIEYGLIAEEVEKIDPELVVYDSYGRPEAVRYQFIPILLLHMMQEVYRRLVIQQSIQDVILSRLDILENSM